ncbi:putative lipoprotein YiaD [Fundidesulfovibrio magnetotacticus]|uniref:Putative lipoprotein YiaD n=1 Tax=Fundidesulfovibrio magnetotacticus TaxID=2730080 RepID=A0A6V8LSW0_9BACT|nr:OmpA family protein [Fundidesulfovibrio magnetotacticus]GFK93671.1 putative lipoprotein YiaD [Fundidesulfovibrio magnetotacticus]
MPTRSRKIAFTLMALIPVLATLFIATELFDVRPAQEAARQWALDVLGAPRQPDAPAPDPAQAASALESARQMDHAYDELVRTLEPQVRSQEICIEREGTRLEIRFLEQVLFPSGSAVITKEGEEVLAKTARALARIENRPFTIVGHTDSVPIQTDIYPSNWELSTGRACSVVRYLSGKGGIASTRFFAAGRSEYDPVADNHTEAGKAKNRRVQILVTDQECMRLTAPAPAQTPPPGQKAP